MAEGEGALVYFWLRRQSSSAASPRPTALRAARNRVKPRRNKAERKLDARQCRGTCDAVTPLSLPLRSPISPRKGISRPLSRLSSVVARFLPPRFLAPATARYKEAYLILRDQWRLPVASGVSCNPGRLRERECGERLMMAIFFAAACGLQRRPRRGRRKQLRA